MSLRRAWVCLPLLLALLAGHGAASSAPTAAPVPVLEGGRGLVQPGMLVKLHGEPTCTGGFVLDGLGKRRGRVFLTLAAHCVEQEIGAVVTDESDRRIGRVVVSSWPYQGFADDWALVELDRSVWPRVSPALAGHPTVPTGVGTPATVTAGHRAQLSGWGSLNDQNATVREQRPGVVNEFSEDLWHAVGVASPGDSGGAAVDLDNGLALGSVSNLCAPLPVNSSDGFSPGCTVYGPTLAGILERARKRGFPAALRTASQGRPR